jgi:hypothetical protein
LLPQTPAFCFRRFLLLHLLLPFYSSQHSSSAMAIVPTIPGLEVTIEVAGKALPKYDYETVDAPPETISKYTEALSGADYEIRYVYKAPYDPLSLLHLDVMLDGNYVLAPYVEWGGKDDCEGYKCGQATCFTKERASTQKFRFADLLTGMSLR